MPFAEKAVVDLELDPNKSLKPIPNSIKSETILKAIEYIRNTAIEVIIDKNKNQYVASISCISNSAAETILETINNWILYNIENILEEKTGLNREKFYRTTTIMHSQIDQNVIELRWFVGGEE